MIKAQVKALCMEAGMSLAIWRLASAKAERWQRQAYGEKDWQTHLDEVGSLEALAGSVTFYAGECEAGEHATFNRQYNRQRD